MKTTLVCTLAAALLLAAAPAFCATVSGGSDNSKSLCRRYLAEGEKFRTQNRYELARQSYAQALSVCNDGRDIATAKQGLNTIELLLRTMR
ncbi:hypothetical protein [uncultured Desulfovibrio sp.]|uniref:hypothetical protein n=1 Tax=uncultured Desulfovibrio sp. TaxID=167968 RepID=UPI001C3BD665|nr:hypothetical protein [uncultured Desulfovibrio sp.]HIX41492.1 hypothetical protein [Candidatus Desulfovibrio intestinigallinarum]